jgi:hypothetical protein
MRNGFLIYDFQINGLPPRNLLYTNMICIHCQKAPDTESRLEVPERSNKWQKFVFLARQTGMLACRKCELALGGMIGEDAQPGADNDLREERFHPAAAQTEGFWPVAKAQ